MPKGLPQVVKDNIEKCRSSAIAAVDVYNRPGPRFRTAHYVVLIIIAWTALFHAIFYRRQRRPWYRVRTTGVGTAVRYVKIDGEPKHWDLSECLKQYYGEKIAPERKNLEFLIGLRNKIEHRHLPQLDASLFGECQGALLNLEAFLVQQFGQKYGLAEQLAVSLQFSQLVPDEKMKAVKLLSTTASRSVRNYVETFRTGLPVDILNSMKYSFSVFLVPRVANRANSADAAVQFVKVDEASPDELARLEKLNILIKEKHIPIANLDLYKPSEIVDALNDRLPNHINIHTHTCAWRHYRVRPGSGVEHPERTKTEFCIYDQVHEDYVYTKAWLELLARELAKPEFVHELTG